MVERQPRGILAGGQFMSTVRPDLSGPLDDGRPLRDVLPGDGDEVIVGGATYPNLSNVRVAREGDSFTARADARFDVTALYGDAFPGGGVSADEWLEERRAGVAAFFQERWGASSTVDDGWDDVTLTFTAELDGEDDATMAAVVLDESDGVIRFGDDVVDWDESLPSGFRDFMVARDGGGDHL